MGYVADVSTDVSAVPENGEKLDSSALGGVDAIEQEPTQEVKNTPVEVAQQESAVPENGEKLDRALGGVDATEQEPTQEGKNTSVEVAQLEPKTQGNFADPAT